MFELSFPHIAVCFIVALIFLGPERLPKVARTMGRWTGQARAYLRNLTTELERETQIADIKRQFQEAQAALQESKAALERSTRLLAEDVQKRITPEAEALPAPEIPPPTTAKAMEAVTTPTPAVETHSAGSEAAPPTSQHIP